MRISGHTFSFRSVFTSAVVGALALLGATPSASAQAAPYVLPYTMTTFAGPHAPYTVGSACGPNAIALDTTGDGCIVGSIPFLATTTSGSATLTSVSYTANLYVGQSVNGLGIPALATITAISGTTVTLSAAPTATLANVTLYAAGGSIGVDPHDIRVDAQGNIFWIDNNAGSALIHRIAGNTGRMSVYVGSIVNTSGPCGNKVTSQGDGCPANDGGANVTSSQFTAKTPKSRGLAIAPNGDLFYADFNGNYDHKVSAATSAAYPTTGSLSIVAGTGTAGYLDATPGNMKVAGSRGIGVDAAGNVYIADTGNNAVRIVPANGSTSLSFTKLNVATPAIKQVDTGVPSVNAYLNAPEDVQIDSFGNIFIADAGNNVVRAIYEGRGTLPGITGPQTGYIYTIAGATVSPAPSSYPKDGTTPTFPATSISISVRKLSLDSRNNLYIADSSNQVVWFVDAVTGNIRLLAGSYGNAVSTQLTAIYGCAGQANIPGDGCPASFASITSASDMGVSPDNQGNVYITDAEFGVGPNARLRKVLSGLNFPPVPTGVTIRQTIEVHFGLLDTPAAVNPFTIAGSGTAAADYTVGTPVCTLETDNTTDCLVPVAFTPTRPGYDIANLLFTSTLGGSNSYLLTGTGIGSAIAIDPGSVSLLTNTVSNAQGIAVGGNGAIYTADTGHNRVLVTTPAGLTTTFAGTGTASYTGDNGLATAATLNAPRAVAVDTSGNVFIADSANNVIRRVSSAGVISTYAGGGAVCATAIDTLGDGCPATAATLSAPAGLVADALGNLYLSDTGNSLLRLIGTNGYITLLAGGASSVCSSPPGTGVPGATDVFGDGCPAVKTTFKNPTGLAFDATGRNIIIADTGDNVIRSLFLGTTFGASYNATSMVTSPFGPTTYTAVVNPVTLIAGTGAAGAVLDSSSIATNSQLNLPAGVAIDAAQNIYVADTANNAIRVVSHNTGAITTIVGVLGGTAGTGTVPGTASNVQLNAPAAVAVNRFGTLQIADSANNRILTDQRSQVAFQFGRTNVTFQSPLQTFVQTNVGTVAATLPSPLLTNTPAQTQFTLAPASGNQGCVPGTFAVGATCILQGQFTPTAAGNFSATFTEVGTNTTTGDPSITLTGTGAFLTGTTSSVAQTTPATGSPQFGTAVTVTATVTPASCNLAAPNCYPTGTVRFIIDNGNPGTPIPTGPNAAAGAAIASQQITGLSVGPHTISCNYSGDSFYAASTCGTTTITVTTASTTSLLSASNNNLPQFTPVVLTATVLSSTIGIPTGIVTFLANGKSIGTAALNATTGIATLTLQRVANCNTQANGLLVCDGSASSDNTLAPGTYTLSCTYAGSTNFTPSSCSGIQFTIAPQPVDFTLQTRGCTLAALVPDGLINASPAVPCPGATQVPTTTTAVAVAQGSTTDVTIFVNANNTDTGTFTFSCSGLPHATTCTFSPTTLTFNAGTAFNAPQAVDMTLWTDLQPGVGVASIRTTPGITLAAMLGWPLTLLGLAGLLRFRRRATANRGFALLALLFTIAGSTTALTGCGAGGPGAYLPNLTPAGTYPITIKVTGAGVTHTTVVNWTVTAPGFPGQE